MMSAECQAEENSRDIQEPVAMRILPETFARRKMARFEQSSSPPQQEEKNSKDEQGIECVNFGNGGVSPESASTGEEQTRGNCHCQDRQLIELASRFRRVSLRRSFLFAASLASRSATRGNSLGKFQQFSDYQGEHSASESCAQSRSEVDALRHRTNRHHRGDMGQNQVKRKARRMRHPERARRDNEFAAINERYCWCNGVIVENKRCDEHQSGPHRRPGEE